MSCNGGNLAQIATAIQTKRPSKWHWDVKHLARILKIVAEEVSSFISLVEKDGTVYYYPLPGREKSEEGEGEH